ncbi:MAG: hypothetical protein NVV82_15845 [Sporocytophaga sp.]|nr:hypothetical protein [Sporocytophaga sp.]
MNTHQPYNERLGHPHDFVVEYRYLTAEEGGRQSGPPFQGIRSDFSYEHENQKTNQVYMIWPEFLNDKGELFMEDKRVPSSGTARMWIINNQMRAFHQKNIKVGLTGYFIEGGKTAICTVIEIAGLMTNPTK